MRAFTAAFNQAERRVKRELLEQKRAETFAGDPFTWADRSGYVWERLQRDHPDWFIVIREDRSA